MGFLGGRGSPSYVRAAVHSLYIPYRGTIPFRTMKKDKVGAHGKIRVRLKIQQEAANTNIESMPSVLSQRN